MDDAVLEALRGLDDLTAQPTLGESVQQSASNFVGNIANTIAAIPEYAGVVGAIEQEDGEAYARAVRDFARDVIPPVEGKAFGFVEDTLASALGSGVSFMVPGLLGARATQTAGVAARAFATYGIPAALGATVESTATYYDALAHGATEEEAWQGFVLAHAVGASEALPIGRLLNGVNRRTGGLLNSILIEGIEEFAQESGQTVAGNLIAQNIYDDERELLEGMVENGSAGFLTGVILSAVTRRVPGLGPREGAEETPVEDSPFPEGAESIGAQVDALNEGRIPAFLVTPGSAAPEGLGEDVQNREVEGGTLYTRDPAILERARMGEPMGDVLGYGISERPQGDDAQNVVVARDASGRIVRGVVSPAEVPPSVLEAQERAAGEGGTVETLGRDEALEALSERAGERAPRKLGSALQEQRIRQHFGPTATAVETRRGSEQDRISEFAAERGRNVVYVEAGEGTANIPGFIDEGGTIYLDANVDPDQGLWGVALHEMQHALKGPKGQSSVDWANEAKEIIEADREAFGRFVDEYRARYESATGQALPEALNEDEGVAFLTENLGDWLRFSIDNPGVLESVARGNRTLFERISDAIARVLESLGLNVQTSIQKRLAAIRSEVADTELTADLDPELLARWTTTIRTALDTTLGTDVEAIPLLQGPMQQQGPAREGEASPARGTGELPTAADLDPATMAAAAMPVGRKRTPGEVARANNAKRMGELAEGKHGLVPYVQSLGGLQWSPEAAAVAERAPGVQQGPGLHRLVQPEGSTKGVSLDTLTEQLIDDGIWFPGATTGDIRPADVLEAIEENLRPASGRDLDFDRFAIPAWHGSGERFDKFTTDKIGTGEGAQAYGWGLYFADRREVAEHYRSFVGRESREVYIDGELAFSNADFSETPKNRAAYMIAVNDGVEGALRAHEQLQEQLGHPAHLEPVADAIRALEGRVEVKRKRPGATYAVTLAPDEDEYLLWDEPLAKQSAKVQAALADWRRFDPMRGQPFDEDTTGGELYRRLAGTEWVGEEQRDVSETLRAAGIRGIKYLDGASRGDGEGSYNYVIFDESDVQIDERFALPSGAKAVKATKQSIKRNLTAVGDLPVSAFNAAIDRDSSVKAETTHLRESVADFQRAMRTEYGKKPGAAAIRAVDQALHGSPGAIARLPERLRQPVNAMRMHVDSLSRRMIDDGVLEGVIRARFTDPKSEAADEAVAAAEEKVSDNLGVYLTRSYQVFDDPKWADKVPEEVKNKAKALLRSEYPKRTEEEIKGLLKNLLYVGKAADSPIAVLAQSKLGAKDLSILQRRKDIAPEIRALWGEYTDPRVNYARSVTKMAHLIANHQMLERVREEGTGTWLFENPTSNERGDFIKPIAAEGSAVMAPLNGLHTTPEIIRAFEEATNPEHIPRWLEKYLFANSWVKYAKTVASPMTNVRNLLGNIGFAVANGHWRAGKMADAGAAVWTDLRKKPVKERREYIRRAIEAGVLHESASAGELFDLLKESMGTGLDAMQDESVRGQLRRAMAFGAEVYQSQDDLWKLYAWENEIARYGEANPDMSRTELERHAAEIVRNTYPTYSLVPRAIRNLRRFPLVGTFVSFPWEVLRVTGNTMRLMQQEMRSSNPKVRQIGAQRLGGMVLASTLTGAIAKASQHLMGLSSEDDDDARLFLAPWDRNGDLVWIGGDEDGNRTFVNLSYVDPFSYLKEPIMAFMRGQSVDQAVLDAAGQLLEPFFGEEILAQSLIDVARNRRDTGQSIYTPEDPWPTILEDVATHVAQPFKPGAVTSAERIVKGLTGHVEPYGRSYDASVEALAVFTGNRLQSLDVPQALSFRGADYSRSQRRVTSGLSSVAGRRGEVSEDELREAYEEAENSRRTLFEEMHRTVRAAIALGVPEAEVLESLRGGMSGKEARALLHGDYRAYAPSGQFLASRARGADAETAAMYRDRRTFLKRLATAREE